MSKHKKSKYQKSSQSKKEPQTAWEAVKDLFRNPFEYRKKNKNNFWGKLLGGLCIFLAICLLFYLTGNNI